MKMQRRLDVTSFPRVPSHYCRSKTKREYLDPKVSISKMYVKLCKVECCKLNVDAQQFYLN